MSLEKKSKYQFFVTIPKKKDVSLAATDERSALKECEERFGKIANDNIYSIWKKWIGYE